MSSPFSLFDLTGKVAVVTGGAGGIGRQFSTSFAEFGADVVVLGLPKDPLEEVAQEIRGLGRKSLAMAANVLDQQNMADMAAKVKSEFGHIDILVNTAGTHINKWAVDVTVEDFDKEVGLNIKGTFLPSQAVGKVMIEQKSGKIINMSSVRSQLGIHNGYSAYCASKGGVNLLTKQLATEWAQYGVKVNAIAPTFIRTPLVENLLDDQNFYNSLVNRIPLGRIGQPSDLVGAAVFLASDASNFVTGHILFVDGGVTACQ
jgi:gluconate 5-dehydrogenase